MLLPCRYEEKQGGASGDLGGKKKPEKSLTESLPHTVIYSCSVFGLLLCHPQG